MPSHPRVYATEAIVLRRLDYGEADRIVTVLTPALGKLRAIARGSRRTTSRLAGHLEPFMRTQLLLATGRDLDTITQAESRERLDHLSSELWHATAAWYMAELLDRFLEDAYPHPQIYHLFVRTLRELDAGAQTPTSSRGWLALRYFELHLLDDLGYRPSLHECVNCGRPLQPVDNGYNAELGGAVCSQCMRFAQRTLSLAVLKVLRLLQTSNWEAVPRIRLEPDVAAELEGIVQSSLRYHLDRELKSWPFLHGGPA